jgi:hypothetical protein
VQKTQAKNSHACAPLNKVLFMYNLGKKSENTLLLQENLQQIPMIQQQQQRKVTPKESKHFLKKIYHIQMVSFI